MKERPILFSGPMVRAILEGRKTVTRRIVKPQPSLPTTHWWPSNGHGPQWMAEGPSEATGGMRQTWGWKECPFGQPGDRLWVRESWWQAGDWQTTYPEDDTGAWFGSKRILYSADGSPPNEPNRHYPNGLRNGAYSAAEPNKIWRHRPSIHMPRRASRILLEITAVRVERLQDISEAQAQAEGVKAEPCDHVRQDCADIGCWGDTTKDAFGFLWESINGDGSWAANPWVWVVEFKQVTPCTN